MIEAMKLKKTLRVLFSTLSSSKCEFIISESMYFKNWIDVASANKNIDTSTNNQ